MIHGILNYRQLSKRIATAGQPSEGELVAVARSGYQVVINLGLSDTEYALPSERVLVESLGMEYIHIPVAWEQPTRADLNGFFEAMDGHREQTIFVHCAANMRVSAFMALYRIVRLGWPLERALPDLYAIWHPNAIWQQFIDHILLQSRGGSTGGELR